MANKVGPLIKEARTNAGLSQEALAKKISGISAADIGKAERGEKELTQAVLKEIAKLTGVTQKSLIDAAKASTYSAKKTTGTTTKKTTSAAKKTSSSGTAAKKISMQLTAAEKKLVELYREADSEKRKNAVAVLKGEQPEGADLLSTLLGSAVEMLGKK